MNALPRLLSITLLLASLLSAVQTETWQGLYIDPRHPGKCTINPELVLNPGVSIKDPTRDCGQIVCGHMGEVAFLGCGINVLPLACRHGEFINPELPYPDCCKRALLCN